MRCSARFSAQQLPEPRPCVMRFSAIGLEQLDRVAGWIFDQNLLPAIALHNLIAEADAGTLELRDRRREILDLQLDAVPAARRGRWNVTVSC